MARRDEPFLQHRCRHEQRITPRHDLTCAKGIDPYTVAQRLTPEQQHTLHYSLPRGWPCSLGQRAGLSCSGYEPHTADEIAAYERGIEDMIAAQARNMCICGAPLVWVGNFFTCPKPCAEPISGHICRSDSTHG